MPNKIDITRLNDLTNVLAVVVAVLPVLHSAMIKP